MLVPANTERQLAAMPSRQRSSTQSYYAQPVLTAPPQPFLLKGPSAKQEAIVKVPAGMRILPPKPSERVVGVKTNRSARSAASATPRRKRGPTSRESEQRRFASSHQRKLRSTPSTPSRHHLSAVKLQPTIADLDKEVHGTDKLMMELQSLINFLNRQVSNLNTIVLNLRHDLSRATDRIKELERH